MQILRLSILQLKFAYQNSLSLDPEIAYSLEPVVRILFKSRFASANTVPGTQKYHSFVPSAESTLMLRKYSSSLECDVFPKKTVRQRRKKSAHTL